MSLTTTGMSAFAITCAISPPIVPPPSTAAFDTNMRVGPPGSSGRRRLASGRRRHTPHMATDPRVRRAEAADARTAAELMHRFNVEYDEPIDEPDVLERRYRKQLG